LTEKNQALDLGAGTLEDSEYLLKQDFVKVIALDSESTLLEMATDIKNERLELIINKFEDFNFPKENFDLINAQYSLPFTNPKHFPKVFESIKKSLVQNGIFVGQLFGNRDEWSKNKNMTFLTEKEVKGLIENMEVIKFQEEEKDGKTAAGEEKHWHIFNLILRKK